MSSSGALDSDRFSPAGDRRSSGAGSVPAGSPPTHVRYRVLGILCAAATIAYVQRYAMNDLVEPIRDGMGLDKDQMGTVMSGFFTAYALFQIPAGWLGERWGSRRALALYAVLWSLLTGMMGLCSSWLGLIVVWSLMGAAQAGLFPCAMIAVRDWLPATRRAFASGMLASCMSLGGVITPYVCISLRHDANWSWQAVYMALALPGLAWAIAYFAWFRDRPETHPRVNAAEIALIRGIGQTAVAQPAGESQQPPREKLPWGVLLSSVPMWLICSQQFFRAAAQVLFGTWFVSYLRHAPELSDDEIKLLAGVPLWMLIIGNIIGGALSDWILARTGSRRWARQGFSVVNLLACAALFAAASQVQSIYLAVWLIGAACLAMALGGVSAYAITMDMGGAHVAIVFSIMNMAGSFGSAVFPKYVGWLLEKTHDWSHVLLSIALIYLASAICWLLLNPNGSVFDRRSTENDTAALPSDQL